MSRFSHVLLDLDGTITNPQEGITRSVACALDHFAIPYSSLESLCPFIGPPLDVSFSEYGISKADMPIAIEKFREYYREKGIFECEIFEGIPALLKTLKEHDKQVFLATSKVRVFARMILEHYNITEYFDFISGSEFDGTRTIKGEVIKYALEETKTIVSPSVVMVGDRKHDIIGAKSQNLCSVGILYGFGSEQEFKDANADHIIDTVENLKVFLTQ